MEQSIHHCGTGSSGGVQGEWGGDCVRSGCNDAWNRSYGVRGGGEDVRSGESRQRGGHYLGTAGAWLVGSGHDSVGCIAPGIATASGVQQSL